MSAGAGRPRAASPAWLLGWVACSGVIFLTGVARGQLSQGTDVDVSRKRGNDTECAISVNPTDPQRLFSLCNTDGAGLVAARSFDGGMRWEYVDPVDMTIADDDQGQGPRADVDPSLAWDSFGNLFVAYLDIPHNVVLLLSTDGGATFRELKRFEGSMDQPTVVAARTSEAGAPVAVWVVWNESNHMFASGAAVTGLDAVGAFTAPQRIPGADACSFGDVAIAPDGAVVQICQTRTVDGDLPSTLLVNIDADGLGQAGFGLPVDTIATNVGWLDHIPAQAANGVDAAAGLAFDVNPASPHFRRLYLVYTEEVRDENNDTEILVRFSDDQGKSWSGPIRVNDDPGTRSQFLPRIATSPASGNVAVCWHDARHSATNTAVQVFCSLATPTGASPAFLPNVAVSDAVSTSNGAGVEFGDYGGLAYAGEVAHPIWADLSNSTGDNPDSRASFDAMTDRLTAGSAASTGDPHVTTVTGVRYDFQGGGDFVALRSYDGMEIQVRITPVAAPMAPGRGPYHGLATNVAVNTAVAVRAGRHRVTVEAGGSPGAPRLRIDGVPTMLGPGGAELGDGARVLDSPVGNGVEIDFPNGTVLFVTPGWWASGKLGYLNLNVYQTPAVEGLMGATARGSWLPALSDGTALGPMPATGAERYDALYRRFAEAWRVLPARSLFDAPEPAAGCDPRDGRGARSGCRGPLPPPEQDQARSRARGACAGIEPERRKDCVFDVEVTGDPGFAQAYRVTRALDEGATATRLFVDAASSRAGKAVTFTAVVTRLARSGGGAPAGSVRLRVDGEEVGAPLRLDAGGRASWTTAALAPGRHEVRAEYIPGGRYLLLRSTSAVLAFAVASAER